MHQLKNFLLFPLLLISYWCAAQVHPVYGTVILTPPYSVYLPDYAAEGQLRLLLQQRDLSQASYLLTIRMDLKLNGRSIMRTSPNYRPAPFSIAPGNPVALTGTDLLPYLDARNIDFSGYSRSEYERTKSLPEGSYTLCFTAYDYRRPEVAVSSATCGFYYLAKAEPPLINLPQCGSLIPSQGAMSVLFQWMPRNTSSLNSAMNTTYRFELFEVRPEGANPKAVVANSRPIFTEDIDQTQFFYNSTHPYLTHGMQYAWRVQAIDRSGRDAFRNKGYSEVCYFSFGGSPHTIDPLQKAPQGLQAKALTPQRGGAFWNKGNFDSYRFYFRKVGPNYEWFPREVRDTSLVFGELVPQIEYECRVQGKRGEFYGPYSDIVRFVAPEQPAPIACLDTTDYSKRPKGDPLETLAVGDKVDTHGFLLNINTLQSLGGGWYKGTGLMTIPFLNNIGVKVFFDRMYVNTLYQNTDGEIKAVSRPRNPWIKDKLGAQGIVTKGTIKTDTQPDFSINLQDAPPIIRDGQGREINAQNPPKINEKGIAEGPFTISVLDDKGSVKEVQVDQLPATLRDASGTVYQVNTDGKVVKVGQELAPEEQFTEEQLTNAISFGDGRVQFRQADGYALDTMKNMYNEKKVFHQVFTELGYEYISRVGGATRNVYDDFKAMEAGKPARVTAVFKLTNLATNQRRPDMLRFVTGHNVRLFPIDSVVHHISEKTALISYTLEIPAGEEKDGLNIYAMLRTHPDKAHCIGKLTALSYRPQHLEVVMVYVGKTANKINLTDIQASLDKIYNPIGVYIKVKEDQNFNPDPKWDINSDNKLNVLGSGAFSTLTPEMKALNAAYRATPQYNSKQAVLFVLAKSDSANIAGDMPRGEQFGYIFTEALKNVDVGWLVAHELGHGLFTLQHSWKNNGESSEGKTDNLMDYTKKASLSKYQWDLIHNPENVWDWLKRDQESMSIYSNYVPQVLANLDDSTFNLVTPAGEKITLPKRAHFVFKYGIVNKSQLQTPIGYLEGFTLDGKKYQAYIVSQSMFTGYKDEEGNQYVDQYTATNQDDLATLLHLGRNGYRWSQYKIALPAYSGTSLPVNYVSFNKTFQDPWYQQTELKPYSTIKGILDNVGEDWQIKQDFIERQLQNQNKTAHLWILKAIELRTAYPASFLRFTDCYESWNTALTYTQTATGSTTGTYTQTINCQGKWEGILRNKPDLFSQWKTQPDIFYQQFVAEFIQYIQEEETIKTNFLSQLNASTTCDAINLFLTVCSNDEITQIPWAKRQLLLQLLAGANLYGDQLETNIVRLVKYLPVSDRVNLLVALTDVKNNRNESLLKAFVGRKIADLNGAQFEAFIRTIHQYAHQEYVYGSVPSESKVLTVNPSFGADVALVIDITSDGKVAIKFRDASWKRYISTPIADLIKNPILILDNLTTAPYTPITLVFSKDRSIAGQRFRADSAYFTSSLYAYALLHNLVSGHLLQTGFVVANSAFVGMGIKQLAFALVDGGKTATVLGLFDLGVGVSSLSKELVYRDQLSQTEQGQKIIRYWDYSELAYGATRIGYEVARAIKNAREVVHTIPAQSLSSTEKILIQNTENKLTKIATEQGKASVDELLEMVIKSNTSAMELLQIRISQLPSDIFDSGLTKALRTDLADIPALQTLFVKAEATYFVELAESYKLLRSRVSNVVDRSDYLFRNADAVEALARIRKNPQTKLFGISDDVLRDINGFKLGDLDVSYAQAVIKIDELLTVLPPNTSGLDKFLGNTVWASTVQNNRRSAYVTSNYLLANKSKLANAVIEFEKPLHFNGINSVTDVSVRNGDIIIHIETKAGNEFFTFVNTDGSNFSKQAYNMLIGTEVQNIKVALNDKVRATLFTEATLVREKKRVIAAWANWKDGKILKDP